VSEHLSQGDWEAKFQQGNSSLWQIWPRVYGHSFFIFPPKEEVARVWLHVGGRAETSHTCEVVQFVPQVRPYSLYR
jgi:hypothetical protein